MDDYVNRVTADRENTSSLTRNMSYTFSDPVVIAVITGIILILFIVKFIFGGFKQIFDSIFMAIANFIQSFTFESAKSGITSKFVDADGSWKIINIFVVIMVVAIVTFVIAGLGLYAEKSRSYGSAEKNIIHSGKTNLTNKLERASAQITPSENKAGGSEFTYAMLLNIKKLPPTSSTLILLQKGKGDPTTANTTQTHCPTITISNTGKMTVYMATKQASTTATESFDVPSIPMQRPFHLIVSLSGRNVDVFINGVLTKRYRLNGIPDFNQESLKICSNGPGLGFEGEYGNVVYYRRYLSANEIESISDPDVAYGLSDVAPCS